MSSLDTPLDCRRLLRITPKGCLKQTDPFSDWYPSTCYSENKLQLNLKIIELESLFIGNFFTQVNLSVFVPLFFGVKSQDFSSSSVINLSLRMLVGWCYLTSSGDEGLEKLYGHPTSRPHPKAREKMEEVVPKMPPARLRCGTIEKEVGKILRNVSTWFCYIE